jgi:hypothetical protein
MAFRNARVVTSILVSFIPGIGGRRKEYLGLPTIEGPKPQIQRFPTRIPKEHVVDPVMLPALGGRRGKLNGIVGS